MSASGLQWKTRLFAIIVILTNSLGNYCIARGMRGIPGEVNSPAALLGAIFAPWVALGILLMIVWLLSRMAFLSFADLSYILPVTSLGYVASAFIGHFWLGETISIQRWAGTLLIVGGTILVGRSSSHIPSKI